MTTPQLRTARLLLREWRDADLEPFAALNADPVVMEHFPSRLTREQSDTMVERLRSRWSCGGPSLWAVERLDPNGPNPDGPDSDDPDSGVFIGFVGLLVPTFDAPFTPCVEVGWRLAAAHWGQGFATEGAVAALSWGFTELDLDEIVSFTSEGNLASRRVMTKLGMHRDPSDDFDHPNVPDGDRLRRHVLYRIGRDEWRYSGDPFDGSITHR